MKNVIFFLLILFSLQSGISQLSCDGTPPVMVTQSIVGWQASGAIGNPGNTTMTLCGFQPNANVVGLSWSNIQIVTTGDSWCEEFVIDINGAVNLTPNVGEDFDAPCSLQSDGDLALLQDNSLQFSADASGCITLETFLNYTVPPVGISVTSGSLTFTSCAAGIFLPVELLSFDAYSKGEAVMLNWQTASEKNSMYHIIQKSKDGFSDWNDIGKVNGQGNSTEVVAYSYLDDSPYAVSYYRIMFLDFDGAKNYSKTVTVTKDSKFNDLSIQIYPNPTSDDIQINMYSSTNSIANIKFIDGFGKVYLDFSKDLKVGYNVISNELINFPTGIYYIDISHSEGTNQQLRFVKI